MGISRTLEDALRNLAPLEEQGKVEGFFNNVVNAGKLGGLVEGIRDATMEWVTIRKATPCAHESRRISRAF